MTKGKYIVIEGPEGVGKTTQVSELVHRLQSAGLPVRQLREPDSQSDLTARAIRHLTQDPRYPMNTVTEVLLYNAARSQSLQVIKRSLEQGVSCIVDRNYLTTLAVQYYGRGDVPDYDTITKIIEFAVNGMEPDLTIVLDAPVTYLLKRKSGLSQGERFDSLDAQFLERVRAGYLWEANQRGYKIIFSTGTKDTVASKIWAEVVRCLSVRSPQALEPSFENPTNISEIQEHVTDTAAITSSTLPQDLVSKTDYGFKITAEGRQVLERAITNTEGNVYGFYNYLSPSTIAAAMARLSRRGDDMRITLLDEFLNNNGKDEQLLKRVITAYGDDSVQQLAGMHLVVENASNLLSKKLEWGRLAAYLEQSTRYIFYDQKDRNGKFRYHTPDYLKPGVKRTYNASLNKIFKNYSLLVHQLTDFISANSKVPQKERDTAFRAAVRAQACDAARPVLPVATTSTIGIFASAQAVESLISHLMSDRLPEAASVGSQILVEARKIIPAFLERIDQIDRGALTMEYRANTYLVVKTKAETYLSEGYGNEPFAPVTLDSYWPHNELDLVADILYEHSNLSLEEIKKQVDGWSYEKKAEVLKAYIGERFNRRHKPGRALEKAHYNWDIVCDYGIFRDLQRHRMVEDLEWQKLSPRLGYDVPKLVEDAGLSELYQSCFDISLKLFSSMQAAGYQEEAQYATLLGHRMRWKVSYNAREAFHLHELRTSPQGHPGYRKLVNEMQDKLANVHPLLAEAMIFVNKGEDPELTRLAAERYTKAKLKKLEKKRPPIQKV